MELKIEETKLENQLVLKVEGRLNAITTEELQKMLMEKIEKADNDIILDCEKLSFISSAGLRTLLIGQKALQKKGYSLELLHVGKTMMRVLEMTGFDKMLKVS